MRISSLHLTALSLVASLHAATAAWAQDGMTAEPGGLDAHDAHGAAHDAAHTSSGLPQLDPSTYPSQIFWLVILFGVLYLVFSRRVLPVISGTLENRREHIESDFSTAEKLQREAADVHDAYEKILHDARMKADALYVEIENSIQKKSAKEVQEFNERIEKETRLTEARLEKAQKEIRAEMDAIVAEVARQAAEKIIGVSADIAQIKSMIKDLNDKPQAA